MSQRTPHRMVYFATAFVLLLFFGLIYSYSLFIDPLESEFGWARSDTSIIFTISIITFCVGMLISGWLEERVSPRVSMLICAVMIGVGFFASAYTTSLMYIYIMYGVLVGTGIGLGANTAISTTLKWFPDKQGFTNGAMLMGFGGGTMLLSPVVTTMLGALEWRMTLQVLGVVFAVVLLLGALIMKLPTAEYAAPLLEKARKADIVSAVDMNGIQMMKTKSFWMIMLWLMLITAGGLALISQAVPAAQEILGPNAGEGALMMATAAMGSISAFNGLGRLANGWIWDHVPYRVTLTWIPVVFAISMLCCALATMMGSFPLLVVGFVLLGLMYGAAMCTMSTMVGTFYGTRYFGINYAIATCQMIPAAIIGPQVLAWAQMGSGSYLMAFWVFLGVAVATLLVSFFVKRPEASINAAA